MKKHKKDGNKNVITKSKTISHVTTQNTFISVCLCKYTTQMEICGGIIVVQIHFVLLLPVEPSEKLLKISPACECWAVQPAETECENELVHVPREVNLHCCGVWLRKKQWCVRARKIKRSCILLFLWGATFASSLCTIMYVDVTAAINVFL